MARRPNTLRKVAKKDTKKTLPKKVKPKRNPVSYKGKTMTA